MICKLNVWFLLQSSPLQKYYNRFTDIGYRNSEHFKIMSDYIIDTIYFCLYEDFSVPFFLKIV